jgi:hypothetical protein
LYHGALTTTLLLAPVQKIKKIIDKETKMDETKIECKSKERKRERNRNIQRCLRKEERKRNKQKMEQ